MIWEDITTEFGESIGLFTLMSNTVDHEILYIIGNHKDHKLILTGKYYLFCSIGGLIGESDTVDESKEKAQCHLYSMS